MRVVCEERIEAEEDGTALASRLAPGLAGMTLGLVGPGQFFGRTGVERVSVVWVEPGPPRIVWDGPVLREAVVPLQRALRELAGAHPGELDTMHATPMSVAWTVPPAPALVVDDEGVILRALPGDAVELRGRGVVPRAALLRVEALLSDTWAEREVVLVLAGGPGQPEQRVTIAARVEAMALIDPTYDGIDLLLDGSWAPSLAHALGAQLGVAVTIAPDYR